MWADLKQLWALLEQRQKSTLLWMQGLVLLMAAMEAVGVVSIVPFMSVVSNPKLLEGDGWLAVVYQFSGLHSSGDFLFWAGVSVLVLLTLSSVVSMLTIWGLTHFAQHIGAEMGTRLYRYYVYQPWLFHARHHSATLTHNIATECHRVMATVITPLLQLNAKLVTAVLLLVIIFAIDPVAAGVGALVFFSLYFLLFTTVRHYLTKTGELASAMGEKKIKLMTEGFGGIRELLVLGRQKRFLQEFDFASHELAEQQSRMNTIAQLPRYLIELTAYGATVMLVLYLLRAEDGGAEALLPTLALYAMAGFKLLPAFQQIYANLTRIRANLPALYSIHEDLAKAGMASDAPSVSSPVVPVRKSIALKDISFTYPGKLKPALKNLSLNIEARQAIGIVGSSGAGKTTCIEILLGLLAPDEGVLSVDDLEVTPESLRGWQNNLGYVPQTIFLSDASVRQNIALGVSDNEIDDQNLKRAIEMAHIGDIIQHLPHGLDTPVGERGVQLSGGQRQRIGIARALYHNPDVIVLDEATNALDTISEKRIMESIYELMNQKTLIIIAHRLTTVERCDVIHVLDHGEVVASGAFEDLSKKNALFKSLAQIH